MGTPLLIPAVAIQVIDFYEAEAELTRAGFQASVDAIGDDECGAEFVLVYSEQESDWLIAYENDVIVYFDGPLEDERAPRLIHVRKWMPQKWIAF